MQRKIIVCVASLRYREIIEEGDKPNICDREIINVVTNAKETYEVIGQNTYLVVHMAIVRAIESTGRTIIFLIGLKIISKITHVSLDDCLATSTAEAIELCGDYGSTTSNYTNAHRASISYTSRKDC